MRPERNDHIRYHRAGKDQHRGCQKEELIRACGNDILFEQQLDGIRRSLQPAMILADFHRTEARLHVSGYFAFGPDRKQSQDCDEAHHAHPAQNQADMDEHQPVGDMRPKQPEGDVEEGLEG